MSNLSIGRTWFQTNSNFFNNMVTQSLNDMDDEGSEQKENSDPSSNVSIILKSIRVRCPFLHGFKSDRGFLCNYHFYFLPIISFIIWTIFLFT